MCEYARLSFRGKSHIIGKRTIVRGLKFPTEDDTFKERPALIVSDMAALPDGFCRKFTAVPLQSKPFCHFDIPILSQFRYDSEKIGYIQSDIERTFTFTKNRRTQVYNNIVCPDEVFDLVIRVRNLLKLGTKESYHEAYEMIKAYRIQFMNDYCIEEISYFCDDNILYTLSSDGTETRNVVTDRYESIGNNDDEDSIEVEEAEPEIIVHEEVELAKKHKGTVGKNNVQPKIRISSLPDKDLKIFMRLVQNSNTRSDVAKKLDVTPATITNRYNAIVKELKKRGMEKYIVPYPYSR